MPVWITDGDTSGGIGAEEIRRERSVALGKLGVIVSDGANFTGIK